MQILKVDGVRIAGICACLPKGSEDNFARCAEVYGSEERAQSVVKATGIVTRRIAEPGVTSLDLCVAAAKELLASCSVDASEVGAVLSVTFTPARQMPCNACQAQRLLDLPEDIVAFDIGLACSGYAYGLYIAAQLVQHTGKKVLLLDGDVQSAVTRRDDEATVPVLADAGTATLLVPDVSAESWSFSFMSKGGGGDALQLPFGGTISMDGFAVFSFVAMDVSRFIKEYMAQIGVTPESFDRFVPHQANIYMIKQLAKSLRFAPEKLAVSGDQVGNSASATVPVTIAWTNARGRLLVSGFGGGLSASVASVFLDQAAVLQTIEF